VKVKLHRVTDVPSVVRGIKAGGVIGQTPASLHNVSWGEGFGRTDRWTQTDRWTDRRTHGQWRTDGQRNTQMRQTN